MNVVVYMVVVLYFSIEVVLGQAPDANGIEIGKFPSNPILTNLLLISHLE